MIITVGLFLAVGFGVGLALIAVVAGTVVAVFARVNGRRR